MPGRGAQSGGAVRDPRAEVLALPGGRLLVRHRQGLSLLAGVSLADLREVLEAFDGTRTAAEVRARLAEERGDEEAARRVAAVWGDLVVPASAAAPGGRTARSPRPGHGGGSGASSEAAPGAEPGAALLVLASGAGGEALGHLLRERFPGSPVETLRIASFAVCETPAFRERDRAIRLPSAPKPERPAAALEAADRNAIRPRLAGRDLVVAALEEVPYRALLEVQAAGLGAGVPILFVTAEPDGVRVGPTVVPGVSLPCLACGLATALGPALPPTDSRGDLLELAGHLRVGRLDARLAGEAVAGEVAALLAPSGVPRGLAGALLLDRAGGLRTLPLRHFEDCPECAGATISAIGPRVRELAARLAAARVRGAERRPARALGPSGAGAPDPSGSPASRKGGFSVGIVGGGAAGYLAALALRARRPAARVTLIEAPDIPPLGVGEATTPLLPQFLHADLGISARDLFAAVRPTFKLGIRFAWGDSQGPGFPYPFGPVRTLEAKAWDGDLEACSLQALHMAAGTLPVAESAPSDGAAAAPRGTFGTEVAYHLDSGRFAAFLGRLAEARGVEGVRTRIAGVEVASDGDAVEALVTADGRRLAFDLYLDCSGFGSLLMGEALGSPWIDYSGSLLTDRGLVGRAPHGGRLAPNTRAETLDAGWCWSIPQEEADHVGYVYGSAFATPERAAEELERLRPGVSGLRELRFRPGRRRHFWRGNVVALGNAYGFVEPLESTALHLLIRQIGLLLRNLPREGPPPRGGRATAELLNRRVGAFWDYVRWFLALHFRFNGRSGSPFWTTCRGEVDVSSHGEILELFRERGPLAYQPALESVFDFPDPLWGPAGVDVILLGQDVPALLPRPAWPREAWRGHVRLARSVAAGSMTQEAVLAALADHPEILDALDAGFRAHGPAF